MSKRPERPSRRDPRGERPSRGPRRTGPPPSGPRRGARDEGASDERPPRRAPRSEGEGRSSGPRRPSGPGSRGSDRPARPYRDRGESSDRPPRRGAGDRDERGSGERSFSKGPRSGGPKRSFGDRDDRGSDGRFSKGPRSGGPKRSFGDRSDRGSDGRFSKGPRTGGPKRSFGDRDERPAKRGFGDDRPGRRPSRDDGPPQRPAKAWPRQSKDERTFKEGDPLTRRPFKKGERSNRFSLPNPANEGLIRLNRYLSNAGVASRREADELITTGAVTVNGVVVTELGTKVKPTDTVHFGGQKLSMEQKRYVLLNKPKDTITTTDDPKERHTVMDLVAKAGPERLYPVGRLDRQTTGVLLLTNDGDMAKKLTHPSHGAEKLYHVTLDKGVTAGDLKQLVDGITLDDGFAQADEANYVTGADTRREVGVKLHMGRNRIVRRMFEALGYEVVKLDRVLFAGLSKKDLQRGHWRHLTEKEVGFLKQLKAPPKSTKDGRGGGRMRRSFGDE